MTQKQKHEVIMSRKFESLSCEDANNWLDELKHTDDIEYVAKERSLGCENLTCKECLGTNDINKCISNTIYRIRNTSKFKMMFKGKTFGI